MHISFNPSLTLGYGFSDCRLYQLFNLKANLNFHSYKMLSSVYCALGYVGLLEIYLLICCILSLSWLGSGNGTVERDWSFCG